ncbi:hypothetical protein [Wocania ichthyoenteri]|uniref:hypothetical protein n=1 Tax=Wocania ichthyoenteri TaxID=1230531 RepID=UPI00053EB931|nr:hypothetical protein [Wocania ichthyoenteri]
MANNKKIKMEDSWYQFYTICAVLCGIGVVLFGYLATKRDRYLNNLEKINEKHKMTEINEKAEKVLVNSENKEFFDETDFNPYMKYFPNGGFKVVYQNEGKKNNVKIYGKNPLLDLETESNIIIDEKGLGWLVIEGGMIKLPGDISVSGGVTKHGIDHNAIDKRQFVLSLYEGVTRGLVIIRNKPNFIFALGAELDDNKNDPFHPKK